MRPPAIEKSQKCSWNDAAAGTFRLQPLHEKAHGEHGLGGKAEQDPPIEPVDENVFQIGAERMWQFSEQE